MRINIFQFSSPALVLLISISLILLFWAEKLEVILPAFLCTYLIICLIENVYLEDKLQQ